MTLTLTPADRADLIGRYEAGPSVLRAAVEAAEAAGALDRTDGPAGSWSARQVAHHVADSETTSYIRLRRLLAEDEPLILGYDEGLFARRLHYEARPVAGSLLVVDAVRASSAELLSHLADDDWSRAGSHSESGRYSVEDWLRLYAAHCHDHAEQASAAAGLVTDR